MWEMWVLPVVAGNIPFPGVCLSFPTGCIKSVEGGAVNDAGTFQTGLFWGIAAAIQNKEYFCMKKK